MDQDSKVCPQCAETVKAAALICRYCRYEFPAEQHQGGTLADGETMTATTSTAPVSEPFFTKEVTIAALAFLLLVMPLGFGLFYLMGAEQQAPAAPDYSEQAKRQITKDMLDPEAAQFRITLSDDKCVSGQVNAKNSFGAYTGFKDFIYSVKTGRVFVAGQDIALGVDENLTKMKDITTYMQHSNDCLAGSF